MLLFGTAVITGSMLLWPFLSRLFGGGFPNVGALEAVQMINRRDALVLDGRDKTEFAASHIPNARNIPFPELASRIREIEKYKSRPIIVNCGNDTRAAALCASLKKAGFGEVFVLREGMRGWSGANLPVEKLK